MTMSTSALGACKATLRGELAQAQTAPSRPVFVGKFLFFDLAETTLANQTGSAKRFQSFVVPNTSTALPIPFALDIDSPNDCPSELELSVSDQDRSILRFGAHDFGLTGRKTIRLDKYEIIPVWGPHF